MSDAANTKNELLEDYTKRPVPVEKSVRWSGLALVVISIFISLPAYLQGIKLGQQMGFYQSTVAFLAGSLVLMAIGCCCGVVGAKTRLSTYMLTRYAFGAKGAIFVNLMVSITIFGWFGVVVAEFGQAVLKSMEIMGWGGAADPRLYTVIGCILMVATAIFGFKGLNTLANVVTPLLLISAALLIYLALDKAGFAGIAGAVGSSDGLGLGNAISSVVGAMIISMVIFPDYSRYVRNTKHAIGGVVASLSLLPVFFLSASMPALATGESELVAVISAMGLGLMGLFVIIFAAWTTNTSNLYVTTLSLSTVFTSRKSWHLTIFCGFFGLGIALAGISDYLIPFLIFLGIAIPPIGAVYVVHFFIFSRGRYEDTTLQNAPGVCYSAFAAWAIASVVAYLSANGWLTLTGIPSCDSLLVAAAAYYGLKKYSCAGVADMAKDKAVVGSRTD